jgi:hypothetical protein
MKQSDFWKYISLIDTKALESEDEQQAIVRIIEELALLPVKEICSFYDHLTDVLFELDTRRHFEASESKSDDSFLYARCYVVGMGRDFYKSVLSNPKLMPAGLKWFEYLLSVPEEAWSAATGEGSGDWDYSPKKSYESGSNLSGWGLQQGLVSDFRMYDTKELVEEMIVADRSEKASLGAKYSELAKIFSDSLQKFDVKTNSSCVQVFLQLTPMVTHGQHRVILGNKNSECITFESGVRPRTYLAMSENERLAFFVELMSTAIEQLGLPDNSLQARLLQAKDYSISEAAASYGLSAV